ncbi:MAG: CHASE domain-containing protein [Microgenomates group bacterium]
MKDVQPKKQFYVVLVFLVILLTFNFVLRQVTKERQMDGSQKLFKEASHDIKESIEYRLSGYASTLNFGKRLFESSDSITRTEFTSFYSDLGQTQPELADGVELVSYVEKVQDKKAYVNRIKMEKTQIPFQFLYFNLKTLEEKETGYIFNYIVPHKNGSRFFGYDAAEISELKDAFRKSENENRMIMTRQINIFGKDLIFFIQPIYEKNTKLTAMKLNGFIVIAVIPYKMFEKTYSYPNISKSVNVGASFSDSFEELFYGQKNISVRNDQDKLQYEDSIHFMDKEIHLRVEALPTIDQSPFEQYLPDIIFFVSSIMILGFFVAVMSYGMDEKE